MNAFNRFCISIRKPVDIVLFLLLTLNVFASGPTKTWIHHWRWPLVVLVTFGLVVEIVAGRARKAQLQESSYV